MCRVPSFHYSTSILLLVLLQFLLSATTASIVSATTTPSAPVKQCPLASLQQCAEPLRQLGVPLSKNVVRLLLQLRSPNQLRKSCQAYASVLPCFRSRIAQCGSASQTEILRQLDNAHRFLCSPFSRAEQSQLLVHRACIGRVLGAPSDACTAADDQEGNASRALLFQCRSRCLTAHRAQSAPHLACMVRAWLSEQNLCVSARMRAECGRDAAAFYTQMQRRIFHAQFPMVCEQEQEHRQEMNIEDKARNGDAYEQKQGKVTKQGTTTSSSTWRREEMIKERNRILVEQLPATPSSSSTTPPFTPPAIFVTSKKKLAKTVARLSEARVRIGGTTIVIPRATITTTRRSTTTTTSMPKTTPTTATTTYRRRTQTTEASATTTPSSTRIGTTPFNFQHAHGRIIPLLAQALPFQSSRGSSPARQASSNDRLGSSQPTVHWNSSPDRPAPIQQPLTMQYSSHDQLGPSPARTAERPRSRPLQYASSGQDGPSSAHPNMDRFTGGSSSDRSDPANSNPVLSPARAVLSLPRPLQYASSDQDGSSATHHPNLGSSSTRHNRANSNIDPSLARHDPIRQSLELQYTSLDQIGTSPTRSDPSKSNPGLSPARPDPDQSYFGSSPARPDPSPAALAVLPPLLALPSPIPHVPWGDLGRMMPHRAPRLYFFEVLPIDDEPYQ